jgi:hypothetical protein
MGFFYDDSDRRSSTLAGDPPMTEHTPSATRAVALRSLPSSFTKTRSDLDPSTEFKALPTEFKVDRSKRRIEGWAARYGNVDLGGDRIMPGAAAKTISDRHPRKLIKFFFNHEFGIGMPETIEEHSAGLLTVGQITDHPDFDKYLAMAEQGVVAHQSIGYSVVKAVPVQEDEDKLIREIQEFKLFEFSPVYWPMNELAEISAVKAAHALRGIDSAADSLRSLQLANSMIRAGGLSSRHEEDLRSILSEIDGLSKRLQSALEVKAREPEPSAATTLELEPPEVTEDATELLGALRSLSKSVSNINL